MDADDTGTNPLDSDSDNDGLNDGAETNSGTFVDANDTGTDPNLSDTDGDGRSDSEEVEKGSDPNDENSVPGLASPHSLLWLQCEKRIKHCKLWLTSNRRHRCGWSDLRRQ